MKCDNVKKIYTDNGSHFIGVEKELKKTYSEMNNNKILSFMESICGEWISWNKNPGFGVAFARDKLVQHV